jgi:hypothetical protein
MEAVSRIEQELDSFPDTLSLYRQQLEHWFSSAADQVSHAADLPSLMGMERIIRFGDRITAVSTGDSEFASGVVQCPKSGVLTIESKFESVYDIPLGDIVVDVVAVDDGQIFPVGLDAQGRGTFTGTPGKFYRVQVHSDVTSEQIEALFKSYDGLTGNLEGWLRSEWQGFKPQWSQSVATAAGNGMLAGSWAAIEGCGTASACCRRFCRIQGVCRSPWKRCGRSDPPRRISSGCHAKAAVAGQRRGGAVFAAAQCESLAGDAAAQPDRRQNR